MIVGELNFKKIFYSGGPDETRKLSTHGKDEFNVLSELDIKAEEINAEGMEESNDEDTGGAQTDSGEDIFLNKKSFRIWNIPSLKARLHTYCILL